MRPPRHGFEARSQSRAFFRTGLLCAALLLQLLLPSVHVLAHQHSDAATAATSKLADSGNALALSNAGHAGVPCALCEAFTQARTAAPILHRLLTTLLVPVQIPLVAARPGELPSSPERTLASPRAPPVRLLSLV